MPTFRLAIVISPYYVGADTTTAPPWAGPQSNVNSQEEREGEDDEEREGQEPRPHREGRRSGARMRQQVRLEGGHHDGEGRGQASRTTRAPALRARTVRLRRVWLSLT